MATRFTWDDIVRVRDSASARYRPGARAWVVGVLDDRAKCPLPELPEGVVYMIEFEDGSAVDVHERDLELYEGA